MLPGFCSHNIPFCEVYTEMIKRVPKNDCKLSGMEAKISYRFSADIWRYSGQGGWYFVSVPVKLSKEIRSCNKELEEGWGRLKINARTGSTIWETAIWFDSKQDCYLLPISAAIRKQERLTAGMKITVEIQL